MRVDQIDLYRVRLPLVAPFETSGWVETSEDHLLVALRGEGLTGWGECVASEAPFYSSETTQSNWHIVRDFVAPEVLRAPLAGPDEFVQRVSRIRGNRMAKAGVEAALWDLVAQGEGASLSQRMGGTRSQVEVGVSVGIQPSVADLLKRVAGYLNEGYRRVKIKIKPGQDLELVRAIRREYPDLRLQVDANSAYTLADAPVFQAMDDAQLLLIEQPLGDEDVFDHSKLQPLLQTPLCLDESIHSVSDARFAFEIGACRIINIKPGRVGGFTEAIRIHNFSQARGAPVWCGGMLETGIGRAGNLAIASLPGFSLPGDISASRRYFHEDLVEPEFTLNPDGTMQVPNAPGIGVNVSLKRVEKYLVARETIRRD